MGNLLLRTMTLKSIVGFGQYKDLTIQNMFDLNMKKDLIKLYYNLDKINYNSEIISMLDIPAHLIIDKPGKKYEYVSEYWKYIIAKRHQTALNEDCLIEARRQMSKNNKESKIKNANKNHVDALRFSKSAMAYRNKNH